MRMLPSRRFLVPSLAAGLLAIAACSSSSSGSGGSGGADVDSGSLYGGSSGSGGAPGDAAGSEGSAEAGPTGCPNPANLAVDTYMPNMAKPGKNGAFTFLLASASLQPPAAGPGKAGINTWTIRVLDGASGQPVPGEKMSLPVNAPAFAYPSDPIMPQTGQGTSVAPTVGDNGDGTSTIVMDIATPGVWWVFVQAQDGATVDSTTFAFCFP
jgi:hypothetical protein